MTDPITPQTIQVRSGGLRLVGDVWQPANGSKGSVLLLHGGGQRRYSWHRTGRWLAREGWTAYAFDARGHGDSDYAPDGDYSMTSLVGDLTAIVAEIAATPYLVGASLGGMTSLIAEGELGSIARGIVLVDVVARLEPQGTSRIREFMQSAPDGFSSLEAAADAIAAYNPNRLRPQSNDGLRKNLVQRDDGRWHWHWDPLFLHGGNEAEREVRHLRAQEAAKRIDVPTLLVRGANSDVVTKKGIDEMRALIPHASYVEVRNAGHMIAGDDNDVFTTELLRFLEEASSSG
ncbi:alpha/beta hydrolase [Shinella sp.]|uniref:alpha/beta hydrolase n=1 Tax=Shinella sp. TaxID=1870904 RepID=UPI0039E440EB